MRVSAPPLPLTPQTSLTRLVPQLHGWQREARSLLTHPLLADLHVGVSVFRSHKSCWITSGVPIPLKSLQGLGALMRPRVQRPRRGLPVARAAKLLAES